MFTCDANEVFYSFKKTAFLHWCIIVAFFYNSAVRGHDAPKHGRHKKKHNYQSKHYSHRYLAQGAIGAHQFSVRLQRCRIVGGTLSPLNRKIGTEKHEQTPFPSRVADSAVVMLERMDVELEVA